MLTTSGDLTVRGKPEDAYMVGLLIDSSDCKQYRISGFDGGYTYFISQATTFARSVSGHLPNTLVEILNWAIDDFSSRPGGSHIDRTE